MISEEQKYLVDLYYKELARLSEKTDHYNSLNMNAGLVAGAALGAGIGVIFTGSAPHYQLLPALPLIMVMWFFYAASFMNVLVSDGALAHHYEEKINKLIDAPVMLRESFVHKKYRQQIYRPQLVTYALAVALYLLTIAMNFHYLSRINIYFMEITVFISVILLFAAIAIAWDSFKLKQVIHQSLNKADPIPVV